MCFSASASFTASALLIPAGFYCIKTVFDRDKAYLPDASYFRSLFLALFVGAGSSPHKQNWDTPYLPFACIPLAFGIQQGFEGMVWLGIHAGNTSVIQVNAFAFLFFSHWFWLFWIPLVAFRLEHHPTIRRACRFFVGIGALYGALLYLPLLIRPDQLSTVVVHSSIEYQAQFIGSSIPIGFSRLLYALTILIPLLISSHPYVKIFGALIILSSTISYLLFNYAFVSVWCFFAAILSSYIAYIVFKASNSTTPSLLE